MSSNSLIQSWTLVYCIPTYVDRLHLGNTEALDRVLRAAQVILDLPADYQIGTHPEVLGTLCGRQSHSRRQSLACAHGPHLAPHRRSDLGLGQELCLARSCCSLRGLLTLTATLTSPRQLFASSQSGPRPFIASPPALRRAFQQPVLHTVTSDPSGPISRQSPSALREDAPPPALFHHTVFSYRVSTHPLHSIVLVPTARRRGARRRKTTHSQDDAQPPHVRPSALPTGRSVDAPGPVPPPACPSSTSSSRRRRRPAGPL